ncbi:MAG: ribosome biogenesis GTPase Der [Victivallaceae bacterium]|nr:ribosome biogenesis GTPase Der [Victivallaceae bacterium]MDD4317772.1 ribosome biogenesis GTPase Der [Victivallaceae bacterium]NLK83387.1 ribosome biogenesis GTPase Der [Lentisphaerota bacterium]
MTENKSEKPKFEVRLPTVAIVGRPNVGKSALFNAIIGRRLSIVHEQSGVTRDRLAAPVSWHGRNFLLIDTGGLGGFSTRKADAWDKRIAVQVEAAVEDADILLLTANVQEGVTGLDEEVTAKLRASGKPIIMVATKSDNHDFDKQADEFLRLGFSKVYAVSALHRRGLANLLDKLLENIAAPEDKEMPEHPEPFKISVVGRPNVGKSSLVNCLLGQDRVMVSEVAGTTRDSIDIDVEIRCGEELIPAQLIDTAGLRRRSKVDTALEVFSAMRVTDAIKRSDLVIFVVEASQTGLTAQDRKISSIIQKSRKACIIAANKYDQCLAVSKTTLSDELRYTLPGMEYAPVDFISALDKTNIRNLLDHIGEVRSQLLVKIPTAVLNRVVNDAFERNSPPVSGISALRFYYATMIGNNPPHFLLFVNRKELCTDNYMAYLRNYLRNAFDFTGLPIDIELRPRPKSIESFHTVRKKPTYARAERAARKTPIRTPKTVKHGKQAGNAKRPSRQK